MQMAPCRDAFTVDRTLAGSTDSEFFASGAGCGTLALITLVDKGSLPDAQHHLIFVASLRRTIFSYRKQEVSSDGLLFKERAERQDKWRVTLIKDDYAESRH